MTGAVFTTAVALAGSGTTFNLFSLAFPNGKPIPTKYASAYVNGGKNISIPLSWSGIPEGTRSFALSVIDLHPAANNWVHWLVIDIPPTAESLKEGSSGRNLPSGAKELYNSFGDLGYGGPGPPKGSGLHKYEVTLYALNVDTLDLTANATLKAFRTVVDPHIAGIARLIGVYER
jgi:hypothetical protein